jgi:hypothetical protein
MKKIIKGAIAANPYVQSDYPYGFKLRCQRRLYVEFKPGFGMRLVSQTSNPKRSTDTRTVWNAPKASTYSPVVAWVVDEDEKTTEAHHLSMNDRGERAIAFYCNVWSLPEILVTGDDWEGRGRKMNEFVISKIKVLAGKEVWDAYHLASAASLEQHFADVSH